MNKNNNYNKIKHKTKLKYKNIQHPVCTGPVIDKLSGIIPMPDKKLHGIAIAEILDSLKEKDPAFIRAWSPRYPLTVKILSPDTDGNILPGNPAIYLQFTSKKASSPYIRFDCNPASLFGPWNMIKPQSVHPDLIEVHLDKIFFEFMGVSFFEALYHADITRCDIYRHIADSAVEDFLFRTKYMKTNQSIIGTSGFLETLYFGESEGNQVCVYNKAAHNKHLKKQKGSQPGNDCIRVEMRLRNLNMKLRDIGQMRNPFNRVEVYNLDPEKTPYGEAHWLGLKDSFRLRGINNGLKLHKKTHQYQIKKTLSGLIVPWWKMDDEVWDFLWASALEDAWLNKIPNTAPPLNLKSLAGE